MELKEFKINEIFDISTGALLKNKILIEGDIPRISVRSDNNGILGFYDTENDSGARHMENFISVNFFGNAFYHAYKASLEMKVHCLKLKTRELTEGVGLYLVAALNKVFSQYGYSYGEQLSSSDLKTQDLRIKLPVMKKWIPDWETLNSLLTGGGSVDMSNIDTSSWKSFKISELFEIKKVYGHPLSKYDTGLTPYVTGTEANNGVIGYVSAPAKDVSKGKCISVDPIKGFACWQSDDFVGRGFSGASINLLYNENLNEENALYICTAIEKVSKSVAAYTNLFNSYRLADAEIKLPVIEQDVPDWEYMAKYIKAVEKIVIKDVVDYKDAFIANTKKVVEKEKPDA